MTPKTTRKTDSARPTTRPMAARRRGACARDAAARRAKRARREAVRPRARHGAARAVRARATLARPRAACAYAFAAARGARPPSFARRTARRDDASRARAPKSNSECRGRRPAAQRARRPSSARPRGSRASARSRKRRSRRPRSRRAACARGGVGDRPAGHTAGDGVTRATLARRSTAARGPHEDASGEKLEPLGIHPEGCRRRRGRAARVGHVPRRREAAASAHPQRRWVATRRGRLRCRRHCDRDSGGGGARLLMTCVTAIDPGGSRRLRAARPCLR